MTQQAMGYGSRPLVSIIVAFHNRASKVRQTVESLIHQTFKNIEIVVVDDASSDETPQLLALYESDPRVRIITNSSNIGFTNSMIKAISTARGEFIAIQGAGDVSHRDRIKLQVQVLIQSSDIGVVGCWYRNIVDGSGLIRERRPEARSATVESLAVENVFSHGEVIFRRSDYDQVGGYRQEFKFCQDIDLWLRLVKVVKFATVHEFLYDRYVLADGVSYDPLKATVQIRYGIAARTMARVTPSEEARMIQLLKDKGVEDLVPTRSSEFQSKFRAYCLRQIAWGFEVSDEVIELYLKSAISRFYVKAARTLLGSRGNPLVRQFLLGRLGVKKA